MIVAIIDNAFLSIIASAIPASTVIVLCATGVMLNERVGVLNLGQEGLIGIGAVFAVIAIQTFGVDSPWLALLVGMLGAALLGAFFALGTVVIRANQVLFGLALAMGGVGLANQLGTNRTGDGSRSNAAPGANGGNKRSHAAGLHRNASSRKCRIAKHQCPGTLVFDVHRSGASHSHRR